METDVVLKMPLVKKSHALALEVYRATLKFPREETYGLISQLRRAVVSIPANICEGRGHSNDKEFHRYLGIARASLSEVTYLLALAKDLTYLNGECYLQLQEQVREIGRMTAGFQGYLRKQIALKAIKGIKRTKPSPPCD